MRAAFTRHVKVGSIPEWVGSAGRKIVFVTIKWNREGDGRLSITGVVNPTRGGDAISCGQCTDVLIDPEFKAAEGIDVVRLHELWDRWHLNDMRAGSPAQEAWLREHPITAVYPQSHYKLARDVLAAAGLNPDPETGYKYGHAWLREEVPEEVTDWLAVLPESDAMPARWRD
jgi:hypothetical protein